MCLVQLLNWLLREPGKPNFVFIYHPIAFRYPLFIRLELHLRSLDWQRRLLIYFEQKLGSRLYRPALDATDWSKEMPTPKKFLNKIILSVRSKPNFFA